HVLDLRGKRPAQVLGQFSIKLVRPDPPPLQVARRGRDQPGWDSGLLIVEPPKLVRVKVYPFVTQGVGVQWLALDPRVEHATAADVGRHAPRPEEAGRQLQAAESAQTLDLGAGPLFRRALAGGSHV